MPANNDVQDWCKRLARGYRSSDISLRLERRSTDLAGSLGRSKQVDNAETWGYSVALWG